MALPVLLLAIGVGWASLPSQDDVSARVGPSTAEPPSPASDADPLLAEARASLQAGTLDPQLAQALLSSSDPAHARARRVLEAMQAPKVPEPEPTPPEAAESGQAQAETVALVPTPLSVVQEAVGERPVPKARRSDGPEATAAPTQSKSAPATSSSRPTLRSVALRSSSGGATLTLRASSGVLVGVANQRRSGIVRLVVDASASTDALRSRPRVEGARVDSIRRVGQSVFVTVSLDPGWSLGRIRQTGQGARIDLHRG